MAKHVMFMLDFLNLIDNRRILVTAGTYLAPRFARAIDRYVGGNKIIGVTGSMLTDTHNGNDVGVNVSGAITAINLLARQAQTSQQVFLSFHGEVFVGEQLSLANLHPQQATRTVLRGIQIRGAFRPQN